MFRCKVLGSQVEMLVLFLVLVEGRRVGSLRLELSANAEGAKSEPRLQRNGPANSDEPSLRRTQDSNAHAGTVMRRKWSSKTFPLLLWRSFCASSTRVSWSFGCSHVGGSRLKSLFQVHVQSERLVLAQSRSRTGQHCRAIPGR